MQHWCDGLYSGHFAFCETITRYAGLALTLNSAELPLPLHQFSSEKSQWDDVRRIYRRVCVLRATGKNDDAAALENEELAQALSAARIATNNSEEEAAVLAQEAERVSNATVLAELLAPILAEHLRADVPLVSAPQIAAVPVLPEKTPKPTRSPAASVPNIADLIDGMLSQRAPASSAHH
jgi:hypothetical protein